MQTFSNKDFDYFLQITSDILKFRMRKNKIVIFYAYSSNQIKFILSVYKILLQASDKLNVNYFIASDYPICTDDIFSEVVCIPLKIANALVQIDVRIQPETDLKTELATQISQLNLQCRLKNNTIEIIYYSISNDIINFANSLLTLFNQNKKIQIIQSDNNIRFSVIIPTYNRCDMLEQCIKALCKQDNPGCEYEIIPVDNASTDNTRQLIQSLSIKSSIPIRYVLEKEPGSHNARNTGFKLAHGEILGLIDDDIIVNKDWVKNIVTAYKNPDICCAGGKITVHWFNGKPPEWMSPFFLRVLGQIDHGQDLIELKYPKMINAGNFTIRKSILLKVGGYNPCNAPADKLVGDGECGLCVKVYRSGGQIFWIPNIPTWHIQDASKVNFSYMKRRGLYNGMSNAYSNYRDIKGNTQDVFRLIKQKVTYLLSIIDKLYSHVDLYDSHCYKYLYDIENTIGFFSYLINIKTDNHLHQLVCQTDWLNPMYKSQTNTVSDLNYNSFHLSQIRSDLI